MVYQTSREAEQTTLQLAEFQDWIERSKDLFRKDRYLQLLLVREIQQFTNSSPRHNPEFSALALSDRQVALFLIGCFRELGKRTRKMEVSFSSTLPLRTVRSIMANVTGEITSQALDSGTQVLIQEAEKLGTVNAATSQLPPSGDLPHSLSHR